MKLLPKPRLLIPIALMCLGLTVSACGDTDSAAEENTSDTEGAVGAMSEVSQDAKPSSQGDAKSADGESSGPSEISFGEPVELGNHLVAGEITVFDFTSPYCPPCRQIAPWLDRLHRERDDLSVVKVNINRPSKRGIDWGSPVARQYGLKSIPAFAVYDAQGEKMAEGNEAKAVVIGWLQELAPEDGR